jgi:cephalosporin hydroxylase
MSEYILNRDMTTYTYPPHMRRPTGFMGSNFFEQWIPHWQLHLGHLSGRENVIGIEVGVLFGDCAVYCANKIANGPGSLHVSIDINEHELLLNNISPYKNIKFIKGESYDVLRKHFSDKNFADYVYIDGSHLAIDVMADAVLSWGLLKDGGILIFDDYGWGVHTNDEKQKPRLAIDAFLAAYTGHYQLLRKEWQVFLKKLPYTYSKEELAANFK